MIDNKIKDTYKILTSIQDSKTPLNKHFTSLNVFKIALMTFQDLYNDDIAYTFLKEVKDFYNLQGFKTSVHVNNINYVIQV
jgi:hypothetical protein